MDKGIIRIYAKSKKRRKRKVKGRNHTAETSFCLKITVKLYKLIVTHLLNTNNIFIINNYEPLVLWFIFV
jgi:hypothetical protein